MGRTSNTSSGIPRERAHVHFEIGFQINERFPQWYAKYRKGLRNDHGAWNGQNMIGLDPAALFRDQARLGNKFSIRDHIRSKPELLRVFIRTSRLSLAERSGPLVLKNPRAESEGVHGYEIALSAFGVPLEIIPRSQSEYPVTQRMTLLRVNDSVARTEDCRKLVRARSGKWELGTAGSDLLELMAY